MRKTEKLLNNLNYMKKRTDSHRQSKRNVCTAIVAAGILFHGTAFSAPGDITTFARSTEGDSGDGGFAVNAQLDAPRGIVCTSDGDLLISDSGNNRLRRVTGDGFIYPAAGDGAAGFVDNVPILEGRMNLPIGIVVDSGEFVVIADVESHRIRSERRPAPARQDFPAMAETDHWRNSTSRPISRWTTLMPCLWQKREAMSFEKSTISTRLRRSPEWVAVLVSVETAAPPRPRS
jgi:hypothetical protein